MECTDVHTILQYSDLTAPKVAAGNNCDLDQNFQVSTTQDYPLQERAKDWRPQLWLAA